MLERNKTPYLLALVFTLLMMPVVVCAEMISPFTSDGCSAFPDGNFDDNTKWAECCIRHDFAYWQGGTLKQRLAADEDLRACVSELGEGPLSQLMFLGVRVGGSPIFPTFYRWGYGWPYLRGYQPISAAERDKVRQRLLEMRTILDDFLDGLEPSP